MRKKSLFIKKSLLLDAHNTFLIETKTFYFSKLNSHQLNGKTICLFESFCALNKLTKKKKKTRPMPKADRK